jgi:hypothetical protein
MFLHIGNKLVNASEISCIKFDQLIEKEYIQVFYKTLPMEIVQGMDAFNIVNELAPQALEGQRGQYKRHAWAIHNLIGHPLMQLCSWLGYAKLGVEIHDATVPFPIIK